MKPHLDYTPELNIPAIIIIITTMIFINPEYRICNILLYPKQSNKLNQREQRGKNHLFLGQRERNSAFTAGCFGRLFVSILKIKMNLLLLYVIFFEFSCDSRFSN